MKVTASILITASALILVPAVPALAVEPSQIDPSAMALIGAFSVPANLGQTQALQWSYGLHGMTLIPDCLGRPDPTPDDDYPGCIGAWGHRKADLFGVMDIVAPGGQATTVVPFYDLIGNLPEKYLTKGMGNLTDAYAVYYDKGPNHCRLWWTYFNWYQAAVWDDPFLGYSSCDPANPDPKGMWGFGGEGEGVNSGTNSSKYIWSISAIPQSLADELFEGKRMSLAGSKKGGGSRGGSMGPSLAIRPLTPPENMKSQKDLIPLIYYRFYGNQWHRRRELEAGWEACNRTFGGAWIVDGTRRAFIEPAQIAFVNPDAYPANDPNAGLEFGEEFRYWNNPATPDPATVPVRWYGHGECGEGHNPKLEPRFRDERKDGTRMPIDCKLAAPEGCQSAKGNQCPWIKLVMFYYDVDEIAAVYRGKVKPWDLQPYAIRPMADIYDLKCRAGMSMAYDPASGLLYLASSGGRQEVQIVQVSGSRAAPDPCGNGVCDEGENRETCPQDCLPPADGEPSSRW